MMQLLAPQQVYANQSPLHATAPQSRGVTVSGVLDDRRFSRSTAINKSSAASGHGNGWQTSINEAVENIFLIQGPASNWIVARHGERFTLFDGGYPSDTPLVLESIRWIGLRPENAAAMLVTHGHRDHTGAAEHFSEKFGTPILSSAGEHRQLLGEETFQVTIGKALPFLWKPRVLRWAAHAIKAGGMTRNDVKTASVADAASLQELPGNPIAVSTPGHTPGHTSYYLPHSAALVTGDALVTGHPISSQHGPQMLHPMYHHRTGEAYASLDQLASVEANVILPGHGPAIHGVIEDVVAAAKR